MDSLTQIVLGAACGEAVAGRKLGNRAMLWGAIGGTIPDLDVMAELFCDRMTAMTFHRGFMHSFLFASLAPWLLAFLTMWFYSQGVYRLRGYKLAAMLIWAFFFLAALAAINFIPVMLNGELSWYVLTPAILLGGLFTWKLWKDYWLRDLSLVQAPYRTWVALFFWSIFTHPILDCFTGFGTQIFQPFSDYRVQWTTVAVLDPVYTVPFALFVLIASWFQREMPIRRYLTWIGILWGCAYLGYTYWHKQQMNRLFEQALQAREIQYQRYMTGPTILNNTVWTGLAEGDTAYYFSQAGFRDCTPGFSTFSTLPKNRYLLDEVPENAKAYRFIRWFTNGYYDVLPADGDTLQINDLRFGLIGDTLLDRNYVFPFQFYKNKNGEWIVYQKSRAPKDPNLFKKSMGNLLERAYGNPCPER